jgi:membrane-bound metal-dependent hydrolase YbcI (DUF457 family)
VFLSHFAVGLAAKRAAPAVSLGTLILACQFADIIWPNLVLLGVEQLAIVPGITAATPLDFISYPYSHSLVALVLWGVVLAAVYRVLRGQSAATISLIVIGGVVVSHWFLDVASHRPDVPLLPGSGPKLGFGMWHSIPLTLVVEFSMLAAGLRIYLGSTAPRDRTGTLALWTMVGALIVVYLASVLGPPPPSPEAVAWSAEAMWLFVLWGYWIDRHRVARVLRD